MKNKYIWIERFAALVAFVGVLHSGWAIGDLSTRYVWIGVLMVLFSWVVRKLIDFAKKADAKKAGVTMEGKGREGA